MAVQKTARLGPMRYTCTRESVERAFAVHGIKFSVWPDGGYDISTGIGVLHLRNLREAAIFVMGAADGKRHAAKAGESR